MPDAASALFPFDSDGVPVKLELLVASAHNANRPHYLTKCMALALPPSQNHFVKHSNLCATKDGGSCECAAQSTLLVFLNLARARTQ